MGIGDSWGTREELLHPRDKNGRFRSKWKMATSVVNAITNFLSKFNPRTFQSDAQAGQFLFNTAKPSRFRGGTDLPRLAADFDSANAVLRSGNMDAGTKKFVSMMDENKVDLPDDVILSKVVGPEAFGLTPESMALDDGGIEDFTGKLVADRGYSSSNIGTPLGKQAGQITITMAVPKGTKAVIPARSRNDREIILDRDQEMRITKVEPDGQGGYYMLAVATPRTPGETPEPVGQSQMVETPEAREARVGQIQQSQTQRTVGNQPAEQSVPPVLVPQQQTPAAGAPAPRNEPEVTPAIGGPQVPQDQPTPGAPEPEAPATPRIVDLRAAVREANVPIPSRGPRRRDWNQAYLGLTAPRPKDVNDVLRELDRDIEGHRGGIERGLDANDPDLAGDVEALEKLRDVIRESYGVEAPAPVKAAKKAAPAKKAASGGPRTEAGLPKLERPPPPAKKAAPVKATGGRITAAETRRQAVLEAVKGNAIEGKEGHSYRQISKKLADGDITPARAKKDALDTSKYMRSSAETVRNSGARTGDTDADRKRRRDAADRIDKVADQYEKLAADIDAVNKAPVKKAAKKAAPAAPEVDPDSPEGREARIRELFDGKKPTVMEMRRHVRDKGIEAPEGSKSPEKMNRDQLIALILGVPSREKDSPKGADQRRSNAEVRRDATKRGTRGGPSVLTPEQQEDIRAAAQRTDDRLKAQADATDAAVRAKMAPFLERAGVQESELPDLGRAGFMVVGDLFARGRISRAEAARRLRTDRDSPLNRIADALEAAPAKKDVADKKRRLGPGGSSAPEGFDELDKMLKTELVNEARKVGVLNATSMTKVRLKEAILESRNKPATLTVDVPDLDVALALPLVPKTRVQNGDIAVWQPRDGDSMVGRFVDEGPRKGKYIDWNGGRRERISPSRPGPNVTFHREGAAPVKKTAPEVNVAGPKVQETITAPDRKSAFREAYAKQNLNLGEGSTRRQVDEVVNDIESGKLTPAEGIERMETEISFNKEELIDMDRTIRETDGEERRTITARRRELAGQVKEQERATAFLRDHFRKAPEVTPDEVVINLSPEGQDALQQTTARDLREQAEKLGFKVKSRTKTGMVQEILQQMAKQELEKRGLLKKTAPAPKAPEKPKPNLPESQYQRIDVNALAEGLDLRTKWDQNMLQAVQEMLDGKSDRLGKNPTPSQIGQDLEKWAHGPSGPFYQGATMHVTRNEDRDANWEKENAAWRAQGEEWVKLAERLKNTRRQRARPDEPASPPPKLTAPEKAEIKQVAELTDIPAETLAKKALAKKQAEAPPKPSAKQVAETLGTVSGPDEVDVILKGRTKLELVDVAKAMNVPIRSSDRKDEIASLIKNAIKSKRNFGNEQPSTTDAWTRADLEDMNVPDLKRIEDSLGLERPSLNRQDRIDAILAKQAEAPADPAPVDREQAARDRQADIDLARSVATAAGELDQILNDGASDQAVLSRLRAAEGRDGPDLAPVISAVEAGDRDSARAEMAKLLQARGATPLNRAGEKVPFDPKIHHGEGISAGEQIEVVRPGYRMIRNGEDIVILRSVVESGGRAPAPATPQRRTPQASAGTAEGKLTASRMEPGIRVLVDPETNAPTNRRTGQKVVTITEVGRAAGRSRSRVVLKGVDENGNEVNLGNTSPSQTYRLAPDAPATPQVPAGLPSGSTQVNAPLPVGYTMWRRGRSGDSYRVYDADGKFRLAISPVTREIDTERKSRTRGDTVQRFYASVPGRPDLSTIDFRTPGEAAKAGLELNANAPRERR